MKKCTNCGAPIPQGEEAYRQGKLSEKLVCQTCFKNLKQRKKIGRGIKINELYDKWLEQSNDR